ncbi:MAG TPA: right-handed parallel beta-helix repeat-containing protein [Gemmatimonadaceae bacterium]|nr:right-handed parallel beta-helix repeat-containing protein [Gemmatimonadaceae bacterium]
MQRYLARASRWRLALTVSGLAMLAACADEPVAPASTKVTPNTPALAVGEIQVTVTNASGGNDVGSLQWAVAQTNEPGPTTGVITFDASLEGDTITLDEPLNAQRPVQIIGPAKGITLSGNDQHRVINGGTSLSLKNLTLTKGYADLGSAVMATSLSLENTTVQDNRGPASALYAGNLLRIVNSTVSRNVVGRSAAEYGPLAQVTIDNSTIAYNAPAAGLGPISYPSSGLKVTLRNSILANNGSPQQNCSSFFNFAYEGTVISSDWSCGEVSLTIADPLLTPLARNGGPNMTHAIPHTSPAYNTGFACAQTTDQRYVTRDAKCDVGAFEFNDFTKVAITIDPAVRLDASVGYALLTGTMKCTQAETILLRLELRQDQKAGKQTTQVHTTAATQVACGPTAATWAQKMFLTTGAWQAGPAQATGATVYTPDWVTPASVVSPVKLAIVRK